MIKTGHEWPQLYILFTIASCAVNCFPEAVSPRMRLANSGRLVATSDGLRGATAAGLVLLSFARIKNERGWLGVLKQQDFS